MKSSQTSVVGGATDLGRGLPPRGQALVILEEIVVLVFPLMVYGSFAQLLLRLLQTRMAEHVKFRLTGAAFLSAHGPHGCA